MLNPQQLAAVHYIDGPLLVLAGAGSGKTRVITKKIEYLIQTCGYSAQSIFAVTFTNKAANEMRTRVGSLLPSKQKRGLKISTFHTLGLSMLRRDYKLCGLKPGFSILDSDDTAQMLASFLPANKFNDFDCIKTIQHHISCFKNNLIPPESLIVPKPNLPLFEEAAALYPRYQQALNAYNAVDFDDLIRLPVLLLQKNQDILEYWQNKIRHLLIDEYQDSNTSQYLLVKHLVGVRAHFTVVGDDDQSVYAWRGAKPENLKQLNTDFPQLKIIKLEQNYRSTGRILQVANQLIANNPHLFEKKLWSDLGHGDLLRVISCKDEQDEAEYVVADLISHKLRSGGTYGDYALLYRGNHQSRVFEKVLKNHGIPYKISGGQSWFAKTEIKDTLAYLKLLCNEADDAAFLRVINTPKRGIGDTSLDTLGLYAQSQGLSLYAACDHLALSTQINDKSRLALYTFKSWLEGLKTQLTTDSVVEILKQMIEECAYESYTYERNENPVTAQKCMDNVWELINWVGRLLEKKSGLLSEAVNTLILIDILEQTDEYDDERVQLMTLHASKGLEFPYVYLVGMEEELLPHKSSMEDRQIEEERRLAYVGITRAQKGLCFTLAKQRRRGGELQDCQPSRFLDELPQESLEWFRKTGQTNPDQSKKWAKSHLESLKALLS